MAKRITTIATLLALVTLVAAGCTSTKTGDPTASGGPTSTTNPTIADSTPTSAAASDPLANIDPCTLMPPAIISQNQLESNKSGEELGDRFCRWDRLATGPDPGYLVSINIYDHAGLDQLSTNGFDVTDYPLNRHKGKLSKDSAGGTCSVSIGITSTSRVDIAGVDGASRLDNSCQEATSVAPLIEKLLPVVGG